MRQRINCNFDWEFTPCWSSAFARGEVVPDAVRVSLPHTCAETPYDYFDEHAYQMLCGYRRWIDAPEDWRGKRVYLTVGAAGHAAEVFVNGEKLAEHHCGYTAFRLELTKALKIGGRTLLTIRVDSREALEWFTKAAERGNVDAQVNVARYYFEGKSDIVPQDYKEAVKWFRMAAENGSASAMFQLGECYENGYGVEKDIDEAVKWYTKAKENGNQNAEARLKAMNNSK